MMKMIDRANTTTPNTIPTPITVADCTPSSVELSAVEYMLVAGDAELTVTLDSAVKSTYTPNANSCSKLQAFLCSVELSAVEFNLDSDDAELTVTLDIAVNSADCITDVAD